MFSAIFFITIISACLFVYSYYIMSLLLCFVQHLSVQCQMREEGWGLNQHYKDDSGNLLKLFTNLEFCCSGP